MSHFSFSCNVLGERPFVYSLSLAFQRFYLGFKICQSYSILFCEDYLDGQNVYGSWTMIEHRAYFLQ